MEKKENDKGYIKELVKMKVKGVEKIIERDNGVRV